MTNIKQEPDYTEFAKELKDVINRHSIENMSNTPDFLLAGYLCECLKLYAKMIHSRHNWYARGEDFEPGTLGEVKK